MVSYVAGVCSPADKRDFETHCLACEECCSTLAVILLALRSSIEEEEEKTSVRICAVGVDAASIARAGRKRKSRRPSKNRVTSKQHAAAR